MNIEQDYLVVLDMDGVVFDSEMAKINAFANLFRQYPRQIDEIDAYNRVNRGIPRQHKFLHVITQILHLQSDERLIDTLNRQYSAEVLTEMQQVPLIPGITEFLCSKDIVFFLNSSAPLSEIQQILTLRNMSHYFKEIFGYPSSKTEVLFSLKMRNPTHSIIFFGDALADYEAAMAADVRFIGVDSHDSSTFAAVDVPIITNFSNLAHVVNILSETPTG